MTNAAVERNRRVRDENEKRLYDCIVKYLKDHTPVPNLVELSKELEIPERSITEYMSRMLKRGLIDKKMKNTSLRVLKPYSTERKQLSLFSDKSVSSPMTLPTDLDEEMRVPPPTAEQLRIAALPSAKLPTVRLKGPSPVTALPSINQAAASNGAYVTTIHAQREAEMASGTVPDEQWTDLPFKMSAATPSTIESVINSLQEKRLELVAQRDTINATVLVIDEAVTRLLEMSNDETSGE